MTLYSPKSLERQIFGVILVVLISFELISSSVSAQAHLWWNKSPSKHRYDSQLVNLVNQEENSLLMIDPQNQISNCFACHILSLSHGLKNNVSIQVIVDANVIEIPTQFSGVFLWTAAENVSKTIEKDTNLNSLLLLNGENFWLWQIFPEKLK